MIQIKKYFIPLLVLCICTFYSSSCNRKTSREKDIPAEKEKAVSKENYSATATAEKPFEGQPNEFCTIIRKLTIDEYDPANYNPNEDISNYPAKYCLIDVCLDDNETSSLVINIGDANDPVNAYCKLIKVFESAEEAKNYAAQFGIKDVVIDE